MYFVHLPQPPAPYNVQRTQLGIKEWVVLRFRSGSHYIDMNEDHDYDDEDDGCFELPELGKGSRKKAAVR